MRSMAVRPRIWDRRGTGRRDKAVTGWVQAIYGAIQAGDGEWLYGWAVSAHQHGNEPVVRHLVL